MLGPDCVAQRQSAQHWLKQIVSIPRGTYGRWSSSWPCPWAVLGTNPEDQDIEPI